MKLSTKISIFILSGTAVAMLAVGYLSFYLAKSTLIKYIGNERARLATAALNEADHFLYERLIDVQEIGERLLVQDFLAGDRRVEIGQILKRLSFTTGPWERIIMVDAAGKIAADSAEERTFSGKTINNNTEVYSAFQEAMAGKFYYSDLVFSSETKKPVIIFSAPIRSGKAGRPVIGAVISQLSWAVILEMFQNIKDTSFDLYNRRGLLIGTDDTARQKNILQEKFSDEMAFQHFSTSDSMTMPTVGKNGDTLMISHAVETGYLSYLGQSWVLVLRTPADLVTKPASQNALNLALSLIPVFILAAASFLFGNRELVIKPIVDLQKSAEFIAKGDFSHRVKVSGKDEIATLAVVFNGMLDNLQVARENLEEKVKARTAELDEKLKIIKNNNLDLENSKKGIFNLMEDINIEKENISHEKAKMELIIKSIGDGVLVVNRDYEIIVFNRAAAQISGFSAEEVMGKKYFDVLKFVYEKDEKVVNEFITEAMHKGEIRFMSNHTLLVRKDGRKVPIADSAAPIKDQSGSVVGCVVAFTDATKEREIDRIKSEFISVASHQLRTPLTGIKWFIELILKDKRAKPSVTQKDYLHQIYVSNERLIRLVDDLLNVSHIETGKKYSVVLKPENICAVLKEAAGSNVIYAKKKKITIKFSKVCHRPLTLSIDREKIKEVFNNLISNAIKYSKAGGAVEIDRQENKKEVVYSISDRGVGIPVHQQKLIFTKFFRADNVATTETGTGLGLYIAKAIIEGHDGRIWFESKENKGATFYIALPLGKQKT